MDMILHVTKETIDAVKIKDIINHPESLNIITWAFRSRVLSLAGRRSNATEEEDWELGSLRQTGQAVASL